MFYDHQDHGFSEAQNCLAEAMPYAIEARGEIKVEGSGDFEFMVSCPVYCKATDGFAGNMVLSIHRFERYEDMAEELQRCMDRAYQGCEELDFRVTKGAPVPVAAMAEVAEIGDDDVIPF